jgi:glycosyltransferase involved in cell wall biosynthesis
LPAPTDPALPAVSITTPTHGRQRLLEKQHATVLAQSEQDFEWLILDDSPEPSAYFQKLNDPRIRYSHHAGGKLSIGAKRNLLADQASAPVIAHFDDDDYYAPEYLATMLRLLTRHGADIAKFSAWHVYSLPHRQLAYWDTTITRGLMFRMHMPEPIQPVIVSEQDGKNFETHYAGFGFNYVYRKAAWREALFPDVSFAEDYGFASAAMARRFRLAHFPDTEGLCLYIRRADVLSIAWPQWLLPDFLLPKLFAPAALELLTP